MGGRMGGRLTRRLTCDPWRLTRPLVFDVSHVPSCLTALSLPRGIAPFSPFSIAPSSPFSIAPSSAATAPCWGDGGGACEAANMGP